MKFNIDYNSRKENRLLTYSTDEYGFDIKPKVHEINFGLVLNALDLTVVDDDRRVIEVLGFCGYNTWIKFDLSVPKYKEGVLKVIDNLQAGVGSYKVNKENLPVYVNIQTGWVCIGNPVKAGNAVEFINNCIAVIDDDKEFVSLWLKPQFLPTLK